MQKWEVDWSNKNNTGSNVMARNVNSPIKRSRVWHMVSCGFLREVGIETKKYDKYAWEIDWSKRKTHFVWARNDRSKIPSARKWHWIHQAQVESAGMKWVPEKERTGRYIDSSGYVILTRVAMSDDEIALAERFNEFGGKDNCYVKEHRLAALKKYGSSLKGMVVRHVNGKKDDNRPENLVIGTIKENNMDHVEARLHMMYWREKYRELFIEHDNLVSKLGVQTLGEINEIAQ
jgi:hypothetical protein